MASSPDLKTYRGNCHCGAFVFEADLPELTAVGECNCSICYKKGYLWAFPAPGHFRVVKGDDETLKTYTFNTGSTIHKFCPHCGTPIMASRPQAPPEKSMALNVRTIQGLNTWVLERRPFDGKALEPEYQAPTYTGPEPEVDIEGAKVYTGGCHCGAVTLVLKSAPLDKDYPARVIECNCSSCERNGYVWIYPAKHQVIINGWDNLEKYTFARHMMAKTFCKTCGVPLTNSALELGPDALAALSEKEREWYDRAHKMCPVNLRVLNGLHFTDVKEADRMDGYTMAPPPYVNP